MHGPNTSPARAQHCYVHVWTALRLRNQSTLDSRLLSRLRLLVYYIQESMQLTWCPSLLFVRNRLQIPDRMLQTLSSEVLKFQLLSRNMKLPVTQAVLKTRALLICYRLLSSALPQFDKDRIAKFTVSKGWVTWFLKCHALRSVWLYKKVGSTSAADVAQKLSELCAKLRSYDPECIFKVDKTGIFFKLLPRRTYVCHTEDI